MVNVKYNVTRLAKPITRVHVRGLTTRENGSTMVYTWIRDNDPSAGSPRLIPINTKINCNDSLGSWHGLCLSS